MTFDIDVAIFVGFLLVNLVFGLFASKGVNTIRSFAVGDKNFSTATITFTIISIWVSGEFFFTIVAESYKDGLIFMAILLADFLSYFFIGFFLANYLKEFLNKISIAEAMGDLYGNKVRAITAISGVIGIVGIIAIQLQIAGLLFEYVLKINANYGIIISGIIITLYSSFGGIKSVTLTDIMQFGTFGIIIPVIAFSLLQNVDNTESIFSTMYNHPKFDLSSAFSFSNPQIYYYISLFVWLLIPNFGPAIFQRIAMAKDVKQVQNSFIAASFIGLLLAAFVCWIGVLILHKNPDIQSGDILKYTITNYNWASGLKGLIAVGIMAMIMSTVDSHINSNSILLVHDLNKSLSINLGNNELSYTRGCSLLIGLISILIALKGGNFFELILWTSTCYMPIVTVPFIMSIFGFRSSGRSVLVAMGAGFVVVVSWELFIKHHVAGVGGLIPGMLANLIALLSYHYISKQPGGWVGIKDPAPLLAAREERARKLKAFWQEIVSFNFLSVCRKNTPKKDGFIALLGFFVIISTFSNLNTLPDNIHKQYVFVLNFLYPITLCLSSILISYPLWSRKLKNINVISLCWNGVMFFVLIGFSFLIALISNLSEIQLMVFMINIVIISLLSSWRWSLCLIILGVAITLLLYKNFLASHGIVDQFSTLQFKIAYLLLLVSSLLIMFFKPKQEYLEETEYKADTLEKEVVILDSQVVFLNEKVGHLEFHANARKSELSKALELKNEFLRNLQHESRTPITGITSLGEVLYDCYDNLNDKQRKAYLKDIAQSSTRLNSYVSNLTDLSKLESMSHEFKTETIDFSQLVNERTEICKKLYIEDKNIGKQNFVMNLEKGVIGEFDRYHISQVIDNIIINAIQYCKEGQITINLSQTEDTIKFSVSDEGIGVPQKDLHDIFGAFTVSSITKTPAGGRGVGLALCKKIINLYQGAIQAVQNDDKGATFIFVLPKK